MARNILVVEDDRNISDLIRMYMEKEGFEVRSAYDGGKAVEEFEKQAPDLVLLDIMLPVMDGWTVCAKIRETSQVPIIMLTAKSEVNDRITGLEMGADDYIVKPFEMKELMARINAVLRRSEIPDDKNVREARWNAMIEKWHEKYLDTHPDMDQYLEEFTYKFQKKIVKAWLLEGHRVDGRQKNEIRPLAAEVGVLPRVHGSGLFTRGQTQVLSVCTLDTLSANQKLDTIWEETEKRYMHHYNFPGYSVGEAKPARSPGRREIGHGALAERALLPVIPSVEEFPYAIRVVSEVVSSNGSTSQGSICGSTLALMDAGVPIKAPVAGISCGLIQDDDGSFTTFIDIQGVEDFHGEMDFKVAGTKKGITAIQMDLKNDGLTMEIIKNALDITYDARCQILDQIMLPCIAEPRKEVSKYAPKMITMHIDPDKIRDVIGKGGSVIQKIVADTGAKIDINDDGSIFIASADAASCDAAKKCIDDIVFVPEVGALYYGRVVRLMTFGAFVELAPGKDGLVHISKLADHRIEKVEDACKIGDMMWVKVTDIDEKGRVNLSHKDAMKEIAAKEAAGERIK